MTEANGSAWASSKSGDIVAVLTQEAIDAFNEKPEKKSGKGVIEAYIPSRVWDGD
jgi:hypothetical protein